MFSTSVWAYLFSCFKHTSYGHTLEHSVHWTDKKKKNKSEKKVHSFSLMAVNGLLRTNGLIQGTRQWTATARLACHWPRPGPASKNHSCIFYRRFNLLAKLHLWYMSMIRMCFDYQTVWAAAPKDRVYCTNALSTVCWWVTCVLWAPVDMVWYKQGWVSGWVWQDNVQSEAIYCWSVTTSLRLCMYARREVIRGSEKKRVRDEMV